MKAGAETAGPVMRNAGEISGGRRGERQAGQSMVEFTVVVVFFCLALTSDPALDIMQQLLDTMKQRHQHYSYTVSLSDYPDTMVFEELKSMLVEELRNQGYSNEEIEAILAEKSGLPVSEWADMFTEYTNIEFPDVGDLPDMTANALESGDPAELFQ